METVKMYTIIDQDKEGPALRGTLDEFCEYFAAYCVDRGDTLEIITDNSDEDGPYYCQYIVMAVEEVQRPSNRFWQMQHGGVKSIPVHHIGGVEQDL